MPRIPQYNVPIEGPDLSFRADIDAGALAAPGMAMRQLGQAVTGLAGELQQQADIQRRKMEKEATWNASQGLQQHGAYMQQVWDGIVAQGGDPKDWERQWADKVGPAGQKFMSTIKGYPEVEKQFGAMLETDVMQKRVDIQRQVQAQGTKYTGEQLNRQSAQLREQMRADPKLIPDLKKRWYAIVDAAPYLNPDEKQKAKEAFNNDVGVDIANLLLGTPGGRRQLDQETGRTAVAANARGAYVVSRLMSKGYTKEQAAGIAGNLHVESGGFSDGVISGKVRGDNGTAHGIAQWRGYRFEALQKYAQSQGKDWRDLDVQIDFIDYELKNSPSEASAYAAIKASKTVKEAAEAALGYERPRNYVRGGDVTKSEAYAQRLKAAGRLAGENIDVSVTEDMSPVFADMTPEARLKLMQEIDTKSPKLDQLAVAQVDTMVRDDLAAREQTGEGLQGMDAATIMQQIVDVKGEGGVDDALKYQREALIATTVGSEASRLPDRTNAELQQMLAQVTNMEPGNEPGAADRVVIAEKLRPLIKREIDDRAADPALAADRDPRVQAAQERGDRKAAMDYRIAVQGQMLGVNPILPNGKIFPGIQPLRNAEAQQMADAITYNMGTGVAPDEAMRSILMQLEQVYGPQIGSAVFTQVMAKVYNADREPAEWKATMAATVAEWASLPRNDVAGLQRQKLSDAKMAAMQEITSASTASMTERVGNADLSIPTLGAGAVRAVRDYVNSFAPVAALNEIVTKPGPIDFSRKAGAWMADKTKQAMGTMMTLSPPVPSGGGKPPAIANVPPRDVEILWQHLNDPNLKQNKDRAIFDFRKLYGQKALDEAVKAAGNQR